jgi:hypothetical protein
MKKRNPDLEFSRPLVVDKIPMDGYAADLTASDSECAALAVRFGLVSLGNLSASIHAEWVRNQKAVAVTGELKADVVQSCVVTLEPLSAHITCAIDIECVGEGDEHPAGAKLMTADDENIEPIRGGVVDLGEIVAQHLGTSLDPYPRKPGLDYIDIEFGKSDPAPSPLAKLADFKKPPKG